jgi:outer membrane protein assembly factor BamB
LFLPNDFAYAEPPAAVKTTRTAGDDWPQFLGPTGDSKSRERGILKRWPAAGPKIVWQTPISGGYSMPSVSRGRLVLFDGRANRARVQALESETGKFLWEFKYPSQYEDLYGYDNGPRASPTIDEDRVYVYGAEGMLHCLRITDGKLLWKVDTFRDFGVVQNFFGVASAPVVEGELLIVQVGGSPPESQRAPPGALNLVEPNGSGVVAFDKRTGRVKYKIADELASYSSPTLATIDGRRWCFVLARGGLVGFEPASGKIDFHFPWRARIRESVNASNPVVVGNRVFISETYGPGSALLAVRPGGYRVVWSDEKKREKSMQTHWNTAIHVDGYLYGCSGRNTPDGELRCIELATGKTMWSEPGLTLSSLLYVDGHFVVQFEDGTLRLIRATHEKYALVAEATLRNARGDNLIRPHAWSAPILSHGLLYVRGMDRLVCLELIAK